MKKSSQNGAAISNPLRALKHKNFRYYWIGMCISMTGSWMQNIAQPWLAYQLTDSPFLLSLIGALQFTPVLLFSLFAGVLVDKLPKKNILIFTHLSSFIITLSLAILAFTGTIQYWHILITATLLGFVNTLDMPTRQSFLMELVGQEDLMNSIALNSAVFNLARIIGPALGGIVMSVWGAAACFLANAISFGAVLLSLFFIKPLQIQKPPVREESVMVKIIEGLKYIYSREILFVTLLIMAVVGTFAMNFNVLVPVFSVDVLNQKETGFGFLMSLMGLGSLAGSILIAALSRSGPKKFILYFIPLLVGLFLVVVGITKVYLLTGLSLAATGFFFIMFTSSANSAMQLNSDYEFRGRVMSVYSLVFAGSTPIGNLFAGAIADRWGGRVGFIASGIVIFVLMIPIYLYFARKRKNKDNALKLAPNDQ